MEKTKTYYFTRFPVEVLKEAHDLFLSKLDKSKKIGKPNSLTLEIDEETWQYNTKDEFFLYCEKAKSFHFDHIEQKNRLIMDYDVFPNYPTRIVVSFSEKKDIDEIFNLFEKNLGKSQIKIKPKKEIKPSSKTKHYSNTKFPVEVIKEAYEKFILECGIELGIKIPSTLSITIGDEQWDLGSLDEFFTEYSKVDVYTLNQTINSNRILINGNSRGVEIHVVSLERNLINAIFQIFETNLEKAKIISEETQEEVLDYKNSLKIFIGHGRNDQWRDLKDHLHDGHGFEIKAYEIGSRAGLSVKEILELMLNESSLALLVLTGEDLDIDGALHARENVIHELGLFQGRLGFERAIALLEDGTNEFSNIFGVHQIRFSKGNIKETYGDVLATIKREFPND